VPEFEQVPRIEPAAELLSKIPRILRIRLHDLRHTHASVLLRLRTPMKVVQE
jgi:integrase